MERGTGAAPSREEGVMSWEREQEYYRLRSQDAIDSAYLIAWGMLLAILVAELDYIIEGVRAVL